MGDINLRRVALDVMLGVWEQDEYLGPALDEAFIRFNEIDKRGRAFLTRLCFGTEEKLIFLDEVIKSYSSTPVKKMRPVMIGILRLSLYQIYFMDGTPEHAIVSEAVSLAKKRGLSRLSGFVNGVLRNVLRDGRDPKAACDRLIKALETAGIKKEDAKVKEFSIRYNIPEWMIRLWIAERGEDECKKICEGFLIPPPITYWTNTDPIEIKKAEGSVEDMDGFSEGAFYVQDPSSMQPVLLAKIQPGDKVLDVCASPGGKSMLAARQGAVVEARDISEEKTDRIRENIIRMGFEESVSTKVFDATCDDIESHEKFDVVIADLPCSGLGVLAKKPDIRYRVKPEDIDSLAAIQRKILDTVCAYVKHGGKLIFSTCTITKAENDDNADTFIKEHGEFSIEKKVQLLPEAAEHDGFFVTVMIRE